MPAKRRVKAPAKPARGNDDTWSPAEWFGLPYGSDYPLRAGRANDGEVDAFVAERGGDVTALRRRRAEARTQGTTGPAAHRPGS